MDIEELDDLIALWQNLLKNPDKYDTFDFMGCINDLIAYENWRDAFKGFPEEAAFTARLAYLFDVINGSLTSENGGNYLYFHATSKGALSEQEAMPLVKEYLDSIRHIYQNTPESDKYRKMVHNLQPVWQPDFNGETTLWSLIYDDIIDQRSEFKQGSWTKIHYCLNEGCYTVANDFQLQMALMTPFYKFDYTAYLPLWAAGLEFYVNGNILFIGQENVRPN